MATRPHGIGFEVSVGKRTRAVRSDEDAPFHVLVLGDFGGRASRGEVRPVSKARPVRIDQGNFDDVLASLAPRIELSAGSIGPNAISVSFTSMEDFHPDRLLARMEVFASLRALREQLADPKTFAKSAALLGTQDAKPAEPVPADGGSFQALLGKPAGASSGAAPTAGRADFNSMLEKMVAPYIVQKADPRQADFLAAVDVLTSDLLRKILHHPTFQSCESAWRGLDQMVRSLELDGLVRVFVLDVTRAELEADLGIDDLAKSSSWQVLVDAAGIAGNVPWAVLASDYSFAPTQNDAAFLARLAAVAQSAGAPLVAAATPSAVPEGFVFASAEDRSAWEALRKSPQASYVALTAPRVLLRLPYGKGTEPIERFAFEEQTVPPEPAAYLWGNASFACAGLLAKAFLEDGASFAVDVARELTELPVHVFKEAGESKQTPCAEVWLADAKLEPLLRAGLVPIVSIRGRDAARVPRFRSLSSVSEPLAKGWA